MKIYLDMCALKRPFDDQSQGRILLETQAVIRILDALANGACEVCNSAALVFENQQNPQAQRRAKVDTLMSSFGQPAQPNEQTFLRAEQIQRDGFGDLDALHLAFAEQLSVDYFVTVDDGILKRVETATLDLRVVDAATLVRDLNL